MDLSCEEEDNVPKLRGQYSEKYTQDNLREAIDKIRKNELSYGAASKIFNVPKTTLHNKMKNPEIFPRGAPTILSKEQEDELAEWLLLHAEFGDPRTKQDILITAAEIAQLDDSSRSFKNGTPTPGWVDGFLNRHPLCRYRTPQAISKASAVNTKDDFSGLWRNIYNYFKRTNQLDLLDRPELWWNADETCFEKDKIPKKVVARRGAKRVSRREMGPPKDNTTVTYAFSAAGDYVEPLITLKDSNSSVAEIAFALGSVGANYGINQTESGWTKTESFYYFVSMHLHNQWELKNIPKPRILTIDGYSAHFSLKLFRWARSNEVIIIVLYPGATPYMQMCDTTMFSPMKQKHTQLYSQWRLKNPTKTMNDVEFVKILKEINDAVIKKESIINGWRATGLQPFNFNNLNAKGLLTKSSNRVYDFKGDYTDPPTDAIATNAGTANQSKVNVLANVVVDPSSEMYMNRDELFSVLLSATSSVVGCQQKSNNDNTNNDNTCGIELDVIGSHGWSNQNHINCVPHVFPNEQCPTGTNSDKGADARQWTNCNVSNVLPHKQSPAGTTIELIDVDINDIPHGPVPLQAIARSSPQYVSESSDVQVRSNVKFSELAGPNEIFQSPIEANFSLNAFGLSAEASQLENSSKIGKLTEKIRRDVKQLGLLCAAADKEKLINILIINQQLSVIDPPPVQQLEQSPEPRTIKSILKPPTMPERSKPKRNLNLKIAYGVVTAEEVVQSVFERESADRQHEIEREQDEIAKHQRENEIKDVDEQLKEVRNLLSSARTENAAVNKEILQKKKNKTIEGDDLALEESAKEERENAIKLYDEHLRDLRDKMKNLKSAHVAANKAVLVKRKNFDLQKKEMGNKIQPTVTSSDVSEMQIDEEPY